MPSRTSWIKVLCLAVACSTLFACGKSNDKAPTLNSSISVHPDKTVWITAHRNAYRQKPDSCRECHGTGLLGGITKIDCFNQAGLGECHANGHGPRAIIHDVPFKGTPELNKAHGAMAKKDLSICQDCHGTPGGAGSNPRFNRVYSSLPAGCETSGCHDANMAHPLPWKTHYSAGNLENACALCHGADFGGSDVSGAPACNGCHTLLATGLVPTGGQCVSCHGNPPSGTASPNRSGSHALHLGLSGISGNCSTCHTGGGFGTELHGTGLTVSIAPTFNANSATAAFDKTTSICSNISCHGGSTTPAWGGSIDIINSCQSCHQGRTAVEGIVNYTDYISGQHAVHLQIQGIGCTNCHDVANETTHFKNVTTKVFETLPSSTIRGYLNYNAAQKSCSVTNPTPYTGCHSGTRLWP